MLYTRIDHPSAKPAQTLSTVQTDLERIARVSYVREMAIVSLICNLERTSEILERVFRVLKREGINVKMMSQVRLPARHFACQNTLRTILGGPRFRALGMDVVADLPIGLLLACSLWWTQHAQRRLQTITKF